VTERSEGAKVNEGRPKGGQFIILYFKMTASGWAIFITSLLLIIGGSVGLWLYFEKKKKNSQP